MTHKKIVVSLCGGTDSAYLSCIDAGIDVSPTGDYEYHTFETDKYASAVSRYRIPHAIHHGDANGWDKLKGRDVFLLIAGFLVSLTAWQVGCKAHQIVVIYLRLCMTHWKA